MPIWIGISGPMYAGKSTLAQMIDDVYPQPVMIMPFATWIKQIEATYAPMTSEDRLRGMTTLFTSWGYLTVAAFQAAYMIDEAMTRWPSQPGVKNRRLLQFIGTEAGRNVLGEDVWVEQAQKRALSFMNSGVLVVSDDLRFDNEADRIDFHVHIDAPASSDTHASEHSLTHTPQFVIEPEIDANGKSTFTQSVVPLLLRDAFIAARNESIDGYILDEFARGL